MKLFSIFSTIAIAQELTLTEQEVFGESSSVLSQAALLESNEIVANIVKKAEENGFSPGGFARSLAAPEEGTMVGGRQLPAGINMYDFVGADGVFNMESFRDALFSAYQAAAVVVDEPADEPVNDANSVLTDTVQEPVAAEAVNEERYFFTTVTTTTTTAATTTFPSLAGNSCWKCDAMTYTKCASTGTFETCTLGDQDCCFVEVRSKYMKLQQLCTGCKNERACMNNMNQNFSIRDDTTIRPLTDQCRPSFYLQMRRMRWGSQQSVCRQCFKTCNPTQFDGRYCFGGGLAGGTGKSFTLPFATSAANYPAAAIGGLTDTLVLGIPSGLMLSNSVDAVAVAAVTDFTVHNLYFDNNGNGKTYDGDSDNNRELDEMTYWSLEGADKAWWRSDLKATGAAYEVYTASSCTSNGLTTDAFAQETCSVGIDHTLL